MTYGEWIYNSLILVLGIKQRCVVRLMLRPLYPQGREPGIHWICWVGRSAYLDPRASRKSLASAGNQPVAHHTQLNLGVCILLRV
jgi:hypothetical protein